MRIGPPYRITNTVVEFEEGRLLAWDHLGRARWRYRFEPVDGGGTRVVESWDYSPAPRWLALALGLLGFPRRNRRGMERTLERLEAAGARADARTRRTWQPALDVPGARLGRPGCRSVDGLRRPPRCRRLGGTPPARRPGRPAASARRSARRTDALSRAARARSFILSRARSAQANWVARMARPAMITSRPGPGVTSITTPAAVTVPPTQPDAQQHRAPPDEAQDGHTASPPIHAVTDGTSLWRSSSRPGSGVTPAAASVASSSAAMPGRGGHHRRGRRRAAVVAAHGRPRLGGDEHAGGHVPRLEAGLEVAVEAAARHQAQVEGGRAQRGGRRGPRAAAGAGPAACSARRADR